MVFKLAKLEFFNDDVSDALDPRKRQVLSKVGAFTRREMRQSIRTGGPVSLPNRPPKSRTGLLKRFIFFVVDQQRESVVIGPVKLGAKDEIGGRPQPGAHEYGVIDSFLGTTRIYEPRPFARPAFNRVLGMLPQIFASSKRR